MHSKMNLSSIGTPEAIASLNQNPSAVPSEIANHLREQVKIISDLFEQYRHNLSTPEQDWVQNAISYTKHILNTFDISSEEQSNPKRLHRRLASMNALTRNRQPESQVAMWNSQFLIATQNLNSAMSMLSWCSHSGTPPVQNSSALSDHSSLHNQPETELSRFLNRRRVGKTPGSAMAFQRAVRTNSDIGNTITEPKPTNSLLPSTEETASQSGATVTLYASELPLTLVGTVERWRQNAEDALKAAMQPYVEQEGLSYNDDANTMNTSETAFSELVMCRDRTEDLDSSTDIPETTSSTQDIDTVDSRRWTSMSSQTTRGPEDTSPHQPSRPRPVARASSSTTTPFVNNSPPTSPSPTLPTTPFDRPQRSMISPIPTPATHQTTPTPKYNNYTPEPSLTSASTLSSSASASITDPALHSPFLTAHSEAQTSTISLVSSTTYHSRTPRLSSTVKSLPHDTISELQIESCVSPKQNKSRGRVWLERQAGLHG